MSVTCPGIADDRFLESALRFVDCQAQMIGAQGYQALGAPGSPMSLLLTGAITLVIAFFGYRLLLGDTPDLRDGVLAIVKIGIVLALATSWAAYRTLVYDVAFHAPAELVADVGQPAGLPGAGGGIVQRLEQVDDAFIGLGRLGAGPMNMTSAVRLVDGQQVTVAETTSEPPSIFGAFALGTARLVFLTATIAAFASVRLVAGLLLALGPLFIAFLLFDGTRSLFEGWVRALAAAAIGAVAVTILLGVELALLEPWLATLIGRREAELPIGGAATELLVVTLAFALALVAGLGMAARVMIGFRLPAAWRQASRQVVGSAVVDAQPRTAEAHARTSAPSEQHSRAAAVADAVAHIQRRETMVTGTAGAPSRAASVAPSRDLPTTAPSPLGQSFRRRTQTRVSASAGRRDNNR